MYGKRAGELVEELRRSKWLPPYNVRLSLSTLRPLPNGFFKARNADIYFVCNGGYMFRMLKYVILPLRQGNCMVYCWIFMRRIRRRCKVICR